ncbi:MAG: ABC-F family ATP-binding cassette domain-containing protein [Cytophagales bacterium]|nr:ABC-F family ATP-binding cassette domain-containing protein [Cytophagales bacterium]
MLSINNISYYIGGRALYENASLHIKPKDKIGLVGLNGTGKSTLLRIINQEFQVDEGSISCSKDCSIGFLNQDLLSYESNESILHVAMTAFQETLDLQKEIEEVLKQMETDYSDKLVTKLSQMQERFDSLNGYSVQAKAEEILEGIGFKTEDLQRPLRNFSGGWRMRVMLAKLLLEKPDLLMLDEPTNHLDLPSIQWIENYLKSYEGAVIVVSHDQEFLDNTTKSTVEVAGGKLTSYSGNYSFFLKERELRKEIQQNAYENQQQKIKDTEKFIERFRAKATKAKQVQSRVKSLERMDKVNEVVDEKASVNFDFTFQTPSGRFVSTLEHVSKSYGPIEILKDTSIQIEKGDKIALIGANGKGKSTLLRIISETEPLDEGSSKLGYNVSLGFYAQHQLESLNVENEILDELKQAGTEKTEQELRNVLGCFLFRGDDIFKKIKILSGGEKSRVALAKTLIAESNFLMLDEPTNHLDMQSVNILVQAMQQYEGTFICVSHNRKFITEVANKIWWIEDRQVKEYPGTYEEFKEWDERRMQEESPEKPLEKKQEKKAKNNYKNDELNQLKRELQKTQKKIKLLEDEIEKLEAQKEVIEKELSKPEVYSNLERLSEANDRLEKVTHQLHDATAQWEESSLKAEELEETIGS